MNKDCYDMVKVSDMNNRQLKQQLYLKKIRKWNNFIACCELIACKGTGNRPRLEVRVIKTHRIHYKQLTKPCKVQC